MLVNVEGCFTPDTSSLSASVARCIFSASAYFPWCASVARCISSASAYFPWRPSACPRLFMTVSVDGCFFPSTSSISASVARYISSASAYFPCVLSGPAATSWPPPRTAPASLQRTRREANTPPTSLCSRDRHTAQSLPAFVESFSPTRPSGRSSSATLASPSEQEDGHRMPLLAFPFPLPACFSGSAVR
ncbi:unnamed protein product [Periconia digitata]|uniref:Uncharacterized protein n=1 Tax=Periconia digitata TaxID=1303443 RepID=A0A9W4U463_9PLEO|nr:unnamed protein product [Periconia digitata]